MFSLIEPASQALLKKMATLRGINKTRWRECLHPQEDFVGINAGGDCACVADGVTLAHNTDGTYPNPSGAGEVARIACETLCADTPARDTRSRFALANEKIDHYNKQMGKSLSHSNYHDDDLFSTCIAYACIQKDGVGDAYIDWASIGDCFVAHIQDGIVRFISPNPIQHIMDTMPREWKDITSEQRQIAIRKTYRNAPRDGKGKLTGYGVASGEPIAEDYLLTGSRAVSSGDTVLLYTDGFEAYLTLPEFVKLICTPSSHITPRERTQRIQTLTHAYSRIHPYTYGRERSLVIMDIA